MDYDFVILGGGPSGESAALYGASRGLRVAIIEKRKNKSLGGTCLHVGCVPSKIFLTKAKIWNQAKNLGLKAPFDWLEMQKSRRMIVESQKKGLEILVQQRKIDLYEGFGKILSPHEVEVGGQILRARDILVATGSAPRLYPGWEKHKRILHTDNIWDLGEAPSAIAIIGGGVVGMEMASFFLAIGTRVHVYEAGDQILRETDRPVVQYLLKKLKKWDFEYFLETSVRLEEEETGVWVHNGEQKQFYPWVLTSLGRVPMTKGLGLENLGITMEKEHILTSPGGRTSCPSVFAAGDVVYDSPALAHTATWESLEVVRTILGEETSPMRYEGHPMVVYSFPEIASLGASEEMLKRDQIPYKAIQASYSPLVKSKIYEEDGFIRCYYGPSYGEILGVHIAAQDATEAIAPWLVAFQAEVTMTDLSRYPWPHPSFSELVGELAHKEELGHGLHIS